MIILALVDGHEEIFVTFYQLKSCRSTTRYHSVLDIKRVHSPYPFCWETVVSFVFSFFSSSFRRFPLQLSRFRFPLTLCMDWAFSTCISEEILHLYEALTLVA